jgi:hypothetical protein
MLGSPNDMHTYISVIRCLLIECIGLRFYVFVCVVKGPPNDHCAGALVAQDGLNGPYDNTVGSKNK